MLEPKRSFNDSKSPIVLWRLKISESELEKIDIEGIPIKSFKSVIRPSKIDLQTNIRQHDSDQFTYIFDFEYYQLNDDYPELHYIGGRFQKRTFNSKEEAEEDFNRIKNILDSGNYRLHIKLNGYVEIEEVLQRTNQEEGRWMKKEKYKLQAV